MSLLEWGDTPTYDIRHHWVGVVSYALPEGENLQGLAHGLLAGWQVNATANFSSGIAFNITNSASQTNVGGTDRPNLIGDPNLPASERTVEKWFNTAAFQIQPPLTAGNTPPGLMHGPSQKRIDLGFNKSFARAGARSIQVRIEMYNLANWVNFQPPDGSFGATTFGSIFATGNAVPFDLGVLYNRSVRNAVPRQKDAQTAASDSRRLRHLTVRRLGTGTPTGQLQGRSQFRRGRCGRHR
jgi:hypothetical protein